MSPQPIPNGPYSREPAHPPGPASSDRTGPPVVSRVRGREPAPATVRLCPVDPDAPHAEKIAAVVRVIATWYSEPGDRVLLADASEPMQGSSRAARRERDRLVESVLRLGRGATTDPAWLPHGDQQAGRQSDGPDEVLGSGSGLRPTDRRPRESVADRTGSPSPTGALKPGADRFALIIAGCASPPADPDALPDWARMLTPTGTLVVITHSNRQAGSWTGRSGSLCRRAALAGLTLTDRLIVAHRPPNPAPPATDHDRRAVALGGHRRVHSTACVFRRTESLETC